MEAVHGMVRADHEEQARHPLDIEEPIEKHGDEATWSLYVYWNPVPDDHTDNFVPDTFYEFTEAPKVVVQDDGIRFDGLHNGKRRIVYLKYQAMRGYELEQDDD